MGYHDLTTHCAYILRESGSCWSKDDLWTTYQTAISCSFTSGWFQERFDTPSYSIEDPNEWGLKDILPGGVGNFMLLGEPSTLGPDGLRPAIKGKGEKVRKYKKIHIINSQNRNLYATCIFTVFTLNLLGVTHEYKLNMGASNQSNLFTHRTNSPFWGEPRPENYMNRCVT